jgi:hypothetical protein
MGVPITATDRPVFSAAPRDVRAADPHDIIVRRTPMPPIESLAHCSMLSSVSLSCRSWVVPVESQGRGNWPCRAYRP